MTFSYTLSNSAARDVIRRHCKSFSAELGDIVIKQYSHPKRHYHNIKHIAAMLLNVELIDTDRDLIYSILFHDYIIKTAHKSPENDSASFAFDYYSSHLRDNCLNISRAYHNINSTDYNHIPIHTDLEKLHRQSLIIRMLDLIEMYHLESSLINDELIKAEAMEYFGLEESEYKQKRRDFLCSLRGVSPFAKMSIKWGLPFTEEFVSLMGIKIDDPFLIIKNLMERL
jgi:predicted metal-dependent HD superfamily phosphohydrolase